MASSRFDRLSRTLGSRSSRRTALQGAAVGIGGFAALLPQDRRSMARQATPAATPGPVIDPSYLFVHTFTAGTLVAHAEEPDQFLLSLSGALADTVSFADRPARLTDSLPTGDLPDQLSFDPADPPNAALVTQTDTGDEVVLIVELLDPTWDEGSRTATYRVRELADYSGIGDNLTAVAVPLATAPASFGAASLFIDSSNGCGTALTLCNGDSDCCSGYVCVMCTVTPDDRSRTPIESYDISFCLGSN